MVGQDQLGVQRAGPRPAGTSPAGAPMPMIGWRRRKGSPGGDGSSDRLLSKNQRPMSSWGAARRRIALPLRKVTMARDDHGGHLSPDLPDHFLRLRENWSWANTSRASRRLRRPRACGGPRSAAGRSASAPALPMISWRSSSSAPSLADVQQAELLDDLGDGARPDAQQVDQGFLSGESVSPTLVRSWPARAARTSTPTIPGALSPSCAWTSALRRFCTCGYWLAR